MLRYNVIPANDTKGSSDSGSGDPGSILGQVGVLFPRARDIYSPKVLVIPRNRWLHLNMTEKLFTGTLNHNQNKKQNKQTKGSVFAHQTFPRLTQGSNSEPRAPPLVLTTELLHLKAHAKSVCKLYVCHHAWMCVNLEIQIEDKFGLENK